MNTSVSTGKQTSKNNSSGNSDNDSSTQKKKEKRNIPNFLPILRKSNKTAHTFGPAYYHSVREAVFEIPYTPFLPQVTPESLRLSNNESETFHVCQQCKDSFRFASTLEEHTARRSWILGYWCQSCFNEKCEHVQLNQPSCSNCVSLQFNRRAYLRSKGMKKGQKAAVIKLFYNQCTFFQHLCQHNIMSVEIGEVMLMPLPWDIQKEDYPKLEKACKATMEYGFLNRIHIMEFLREQKAENKWWDPPLIVVENKNNYHTETNLTGIIQTFRENNFIDIPGKKNSSSPNKIPQPSNKNIPPTNLTISTIGNLNNNNNNNNDNNNSSQSVTVPITNNLSVKYFHTPYRPPADIAFVDCGPSHSVYKSLQLSSSSSIQPSNCQITLSPNTSLQLLSPTTTTTTTNSPIESSKDGLDSLGRRRNAFGQFIKQSSQSSSSPPQPPMTSILTSTSTSNNVYTVSTCNTNNNSGPKISVKKFASEPVSNWAQCPINNIEKPQQSTNVNAKILTVHSEKCLDISSIISQLPPDVINSKKIVFIEQNSNQINQYQTNSPQITAGPTLSANCVKVNVPQRNNKTSTVISKPIVKNTTKPIKPALLSLDSKILPRTNIVPLGKKHQGMKLQQINSYDGKIFYQSGKKFVIKQTNKIKSTSIPASSVLKPNSRQISNNLFEIPNNKKSKPRILSRQIGNLNSPLTPSTSPSESSSSSSSSSSSCDLQSKLSIDDDITTLKPYEKVKSRTDFNLKNLSESDESLLSIRVIASRLYLHLMEALPSITKKNNITKYKQNLLDTLPYLKTNDIQKRIDHINNISQEFLTAMKISDDQIIDEHEHLIGQLTDSVEQAKILNIPQNMENSKTPSSGTMSFLQISQAFEIQHDNDNKIHDNWENELMEKCDNCEKMKKSKNYLIGFSKLSINESNYCQCYIYFCHKCNIYLGTQSRFIAHQNYHKKIAPFECTDCFLKFTTFNALEKHIWFNCFHPLMKNWFFGCKICGIDGLTSLESLTKHFLIMHSKRGYVCSKCKEIFFLENECQNHFTNEHKEEIEKEPVKFEIIEIIMCKIGNCVVLKENYTKHLIEHVGVQHQIFHKCPFCSYTKRHAPRFIMEQFREHIFTNHLNLLTKYTNIELINEIQGEIIKMKLNQECLPMIVSTCTIGREAFEKGTTTQDEDTSSMPMIVDVRTEAVNLNSNDDSMPKILQVKSIANDSLLKKSQESRKRKANTVIEITLSPKKISSVEIKNDEKKELKNLEKTTTIRGISQLKEILLEKRSLTISDSVDIEIIELEKSEDNRNENINNDNNADGTNKVKENISVDNENINNDPEDKRRCENNEENEKNKTTNEDADVNKNENVNKNKENNNGDMDKIIINTENTNRNEDKIIANKKSNEDKDINKDKEDFKEAKEDTNKIIDLIANNEEFGKNNQNLNQEQKDVNQRKEDDNRQEENVNISINNENDIIVNKEDNIDINEEKEADNKNNTSNIAKKNKNIDKNETKNKDNFEIDIQKSNDDDNVFKNNENINKNSEINKIVTTDKEDINKKNENLKNDNKIIDKEDEDLNEENVINENVNNDNEKLTKSNEDLNNDNKEIDKDNENFANKDGEIEQQSSFENNEDTNRNKKFIDTNNESLIHSNEFLIDNNKSLTKNNETTTNDNQTLNIDSKFFTKDNQFSNMDFEHFAKDNQISNKNIQCSTENNESTKDDQYSCKNDQSSKKNDQSSSKNDKFLNKNNQSSYEDHHFLHIYCQSSNDDSQFSQEDDKSQNNDYQSTNKDNQSNNTQSLINDQFSSQENAENLEKSEFPNENIQCLNEKIFSSKNNESTNENDKIISINSEQIIDNTKNSIDIEQKYREIDDNFEIKEKNLTECEENLKHKEEEEEEKESGNNLNALENLKAKMSRTFKTLAKRMESTTTTLQNEYTKSLPMLKDISKINENGTKLNEIRTRTRQKRQRRKNNDNNWHIITKSSENMNFTGNINFQKRTLRERITFDDESSNSSEINYRQNNREIKFKENLNLNEKIPPPPLARIPQHILKNHSLDEQTNNNQTKRRAKKRKQCRIAFNGPLNYQETILDFKCHLCGKLIDSSWSVLKTHFDIWHPDEYIVAELNPKLLKISSDYIDGGYKEVLTKKIKCETSSSSSTSSPKKRKRRNRFTPKSPEKIDKSAGICIKAESVLEDDGMFKCKKCEMKFIDMDYLRQHISKSHRIKGRYLVCLECGENFVVAPSLQMHLKAFHAIDDPLTYLLQNTSFAPENLEDTEEEEEEVTTDENQCYVCMAVFEDKAAVDKHLRVHGMAFLNRKRMEAKKNLNSPEKKFEITSQTDDARYGNTNISLNTTKIQDDKQIKVNQILATNSLETEVSVH